MSSDKKVRDVMTREVECARPEMTIREAAERMKSRDIGSLPVCRGDLLVGVVTDRDITVRATAEGRIPEETMVSDVMTQGDVLTVGEESELAEAEKIMHDHQVRRLPVVDGGNHLVGYLAAARIARTEDESQVGRVIKGISQQEKPPPMESDERRRRRMTG
jgi:CBS domain-containing protein